MSIEIKMPRLSDTMERGTILKWNVKEGDKVSAGDVVADVETDKATMEMTVYDDGTIAKIAVPEGESVGVGTVIALLAEDGEDVKDVGTDGEAKEKKKDEPKREKKDDKEKEVAASKKRDDKGEDEEEKEPKAAKRVPRDEEGDEEEEQEEQEDDEQSDRPRRKVSPVARQLAEEYDVDLGAINGSGPGGRIIKRDIMQAAEAREETARAVPPAAKRRESDSQDGAIVPGSESRATQLGQPIVVGSPDEKPLEERTIQLSNIRQTIARRLIESKTTIPHYQVTYTFDMDPILALRETLNEQLEPQKVKLSVNDFLVRACALAMHRHHEFNASWAEDSINVHGEVNIGFAISLPPDRGGGLVVGVIRNADRKGLRVISAESKQLAAKARTRGLSMEEMSDSTFTLSNLGMYGVEHFTAIINPPNSAILAVGAAVQKPVVRDGELMIGHEMHATLSCDHRIIDGAMAAEYLQTLRQLIENPATLLV